MFLDVDGTLLELAPAPDRVVVAATLPPLLQRLRRRLGGAVALITGRAISDVDRLFTGMRLPIAGQHGSERRDAQGTLHLHAPETETLARLRRLFTEFAGRHEGLLLEDKGATLALHYRQAPQLAATVHRAVRDGVEATGTRAWRLQPGKCLLEVRQEGRDKGTAIADFMAEQPFRGRRPVFIGDDRGDEHGFAVVERMGGWTVKVGRGASRAQYRLSDVAAVIAWLADFVPPATPDPSACAPSTSP
jgi:trehalose 6-phosphate phosphatase